MVTINYQELSKEVSYALRHAPSEYDLILDENGWVDVQRLLEALRKNNNKWTSIKLDDLIRMIEASDKKRYEIVDNKIRALYGHSTASQIKKEIAEPPEYLYHGTARKFIESIKENGLLSKERQYVHLSVDEETAREVGKRRDEKLDCQPFLRHFFVGHQHSVFNRGKITQRAMNPMVIIPVYIIK